MQGDRFDALTRILVTSVTRRRRPPRCRVRNRLLELRPLVHQRPGLRQRQLQLLRWRLRHHGG